jgi:hypothetical protein
MQIRIRIQLINFDADPDFYLMGMRIWIRIQVTKMKRIFADPDPQRTRAPKSMEADRNNQRRKQEVGL